MELLLLAASLEPATRYARLGAAVHQVQVKTSVSFSRLASGPILLPIKVKLV